jgi:hypothetical protein
MGDQIAMVRVHIIEAVGSVYCCMKFGIRKPSIKKMIGARTSPKRIIKNSLGIKAPKGFGILTNPKKAIYNKVYNKTSISLTSLLSKLFK